MRKRLILNFLEDNPIASLLGFVALIALGYAAYRILFALGFAVANVMEFTK